MSNHKNRKKDKPMSKNDNIMDQIKVAEVREEVEEEVKVETPITSTHVPKEPMKTNAFKSAMAKPNVPPKPKTVNSSQESVKAQLNEYVIKLEAAKEPTDKVRAQQSFFGIMNTVVGGFDIDRFKLEWTAILNFIHNNRKHINEITIFNGCNNWELGERNYHNYRKLAVLALQTSDPVDRFTSIGKTLAEDQILFTSNKNFRTNLAAYYKF